MFFIEFTYFALCELVVQQQYQGIAPAVEVGIVTARGGGNSLDHCLLVILFRGRGVLFFKVRGEGGG